jgi:CHAT domain-containing protein
LSGCETGRGLIGYGEGIFGLQRALKLAGVKYILVSLYEVDAIQSKEFMVAFYSNLLSKNNKTIEQAYNETLKQIRSKDPESVEWAYWILLR